MLGHAISLVSADEIDQLQDIERLIQKHIDRELIDGFKPQNPLPESRKILPPKSKKPKKPKAPKEQNQGNSQARSGGNRSSDGNRRPEGSKKPGGNNRPRNRPASSTSNKNSSAPSSETKKPQIKVRRSQRQKAVEA